MYMIKQMFYLEKNQNFESKSRPMLDRKSVGSVGEQNNVVEKAEYT